MVTMALLSMIFSHLLLVATTIVPNFKFLAYPILEILPVGLLGHRWQYGTSALRFSKKPSPGRADKNVNL